ncbi:MAG: SLC13 family permease [Patescibacteria group bacterium]
MNYFVLGLFILTYVFLIWGKLHKLWVVGVAAGILIFTRTISLPEAFSFVNWNVMTLFVGMLVLADLFIDSQVPAYFAQKLASKAKTIVFAMLFICVLTSLISAFVENVATVLIIAPIAISLAKNLKIKAAPFLIAIAICSNLQGTATLVGDPPSMILGSYAKLSFNDFFWFHGHPGIFFAVQAGALASFIVLYFIFRHYKASVGQIEIVKVKTWRPTILIVLLILALATSSVIAPDAPLLSGMITLVFALIGFLSQVVRVGHRAISDLIKPLDWSTTLFLLFIFIIVGSLTPAGVIDKITYLMKSITGDNIFLTYTLIMWVSVLLSAFIDNVPYILMMLPVAGGLAVYLGVSPYLFYFSLLIGASVGGNITPIGASANIVSVGLAQKKAGEKISFKEFVKMGLPYTLAAVSAAWLVGWFFWRNLV